MTSFTWVYDVIMNFHPGKSFETYRRWVCHSQNHILQVVVIPVSVSAHNNTLNSMLNNSADVRLNRSSDLLPFKPFFLGPVNRQAAIEWSISTFGFFSLSLSPELGLLLAAGAGAGEPGDGADFCFQALKYWFFEFKLKLKNREIRNEIFQLFVGLISRIFRSFRWA